MMKNILLLICIIIPAISFSQVVFNSNGYSVSSENDGFPDVLYRENTRFQLGENTVTVGDCAYRITKVLKEKSLWSNSIVIEVSLTSQPTVKTNQTQESPTGSNDDLIMGDNSMGSKYRKGMPVHLDKGPVNPYSEIETIEVGYDFSDKIKYIVTQRVKHGSMDYGSRFTKYVIGSNFYKEPAKPSVNW